MRIFMFIFMIGIRSARAVGLAETKMISNSFV